jgi:adenosine deaminase
MSRVAATGAVVEVCPTSNRRIGGIADPAHHPVHRFLDAGLPVVVSCDDPGVFGTTLPEELDWVCRHTGGGEELRRELVATAWRSRSEVLTGRVAR